MNIKIYEDQTGLMIYPEKDTKDVKIVSFFNNTVDLYIEKIGNNITIYCHFIAYKKSARPLGYYVIYNDKYSDDGLSGIKNDIFELLKKVDLQLRQGHADNIIVDNIDKLGIKRANKWTGNTTNVINALDSYEKLDYKGGNIEEILTFYKEILKNITNVKLAISSVENALGNVNILLNKKIQEPLIPSDKTIEILDRYKQKIIENKIKKDTEIGKNKIKEGFAIMREGINAIKSSGADPTDICIEELGKIIDINKIDVNKIISRKNEGEDVEADKEKKGIGIASVLFISIIMLFAGIILSPIVISHVHELGNLGINGEPTTTLIVTSIPTSIPEKPINNTVILPTLRPTNTSENMSVHNATNQANNSVINQTTIPSNSSKR